MTSGTAGDAKAVSRQQLCKAGAAAQGMGYGTAGKVTQQCVDTTAKPECLDENGYLKGLGTRRDLVGKDEPNPLEKGDLGAVSAIVLHRTGGDSAEGALNSFKTGVGTHFLVDKDGTILQTASLGKMTYHVGKIRSRCEDSKTCTEDESKELGELRKTNKKYGDYVAALKKHESSKAYPDRYPNNTDSVGIEVVAVYNDKTKTWDAPTDKQKEAIKKLVDRLKDCCGLDNDDIYEHDKISYKTGGEGAGLYDK